MNENLKFNVGYLIMYKSYLTDGQLAGKYDPFEVLPCPLPYIIDSSVIHLCTGMQVDIFGIHNHFSNRHILYKYSIHTYVFNMLDKPFHILTFILSYEGINCDVHLSVKGMCISAKRIDIFDVIPCSCTCTEPLCTDVYRICTMVDGCTSAIQIFSRRQKF